MIFNRSVPCSPEEVPEREGGKVKRSVRWNPNRESLYCLLLLVRAVRVVRGSWKLNGVSLVDLKWFAGESKEKVPLPSRVGTESREGRRGK